MKVGTDAVLLGAWLSVEGVTRVLDVGTGTGILALMVAQRTNQALIPVSIEAIELDPDAAGQAGENAANSPWADRVRVVAADATSWSAQPYDLIVSNPPYFRESLKAPLAGRNLARHDDTLSWEELVALTDRLLTPSGRFALILPVEAEGVFEALCWERGLFLRRQCAVSTREGFPAKRLLLEFSREHGSVAYDALSIQTSHHQLTAAFAGLTAEFYLK